MTYTTTAYLGEKIPLITVLNHEMTQPEDNSLNPSWCKSGVISESVSHIRAKSCSESSRIVQFAINRIQSLANIHFIIFSSSCIVLYDPGRTRRFIGGSVSIIEVEVPLRSLSNVRHHSKPLGSFMNQHRHVGRYHRNS